MGSKATPAQRAAMTETEVEELPKAIARWLVKDKLARVVLPGAGKGWEGGGPVDKDSMAAFAEIGHIFIHYLYASCTMPPPQPRCSIGEARRCRKTDEDVESWTRAEPRSYGERRVEPASVPLSSDMPRMPPPEDLPQELGE